MKKLFTLALLAGFFVSCTTTIDPAVAEAEAAAKAKAVANVELAKQFITSFENGDAALWKELCTEDFVTYGPGIESEANLDESIEYFTELHGRIDSLEFHTIAILPHSEEEGEMAGDYVFWWGNTSSYHIETGKSVKLLLHTVYKIRDGKIEWTTDFWDTGDAKSQLSDEEEKEETS